MAASKLAACETGYDDERFEQIVSQTLHCIICTNVIKDPVMCQNNEHLFCRGCITRHLMYSETCPTCMQPLTAVTLKEPSRTVMNLLAELKIRCEFFNRGCKEYVELENLKRHVADCGFAPAVCSNEGCQLEVNKQDLLHHETAVCEHRRITGDSSNDRRSPEMDMLKNIAEVNEKLARNEKNVEREFQNIKAVVRNVLAKVDLVQEQLALEKERNRRLEADNAVMKESLNAILKLLQGKSQNEKNRKETSEAEDMNEITKQLESMMQEKSPKVQDEPVRDEIAEAQYMERKQTVVIAGCGSSVEMFSLAKRTWTTLQHTQELRLGASSVVYNNQLFIVGGYVKTIEKLSLNSLQDGQLLPFENFPAQLPGELAGHCSVVYNGRLIVIGGYVGGKDAYSDSITEISLVPPYTSRILATMPQTRCYHGVAVFGDKMLIVGGRRTGDNQSVLRSVVMYDITRNEFQQLTPLPYPVCEMATVKCGDDSVMIMGGSDKDDEPLNKVLMYNIKTLKIQMLPEMKYKRAGCVAAVVKDTVIVMGGQDEGANHLKSVESFRFDRFTWEELPEMHEARERATAVAC